jgi:hypothetical protein
MRGLVRFSWKAYDVRPDGSVTLPPITGYGPHDEEFNWLLVLGIAAIAFLVLTIR